MNQWSAYGLINYATQALDTRILRGGDAMLIPANWSTNLYLRSNSSKKVIIGVGSSYTTGTQKNCQSFNISSELTVKPINQLRFSFTINWSKNSDQLQFVAIKSYQSRSSYVLGNLDQKNLGFTFRIDYNITPEWSLQYYGSPFASVGKYSNYKYTTDTRAPTFFRRFAEFNNPLLTGNEYWLDVDRDLIMDYSINNPDFSFGQFRSNFVAKWEYRPGSSLYFVWSNEQTAYIQPGDNSLKGSFKQLKSVFPKNLFLIKLNYWFSI